MNHDEIKKVLIILVRSLVDNPDKVSLEYTLASKTLIFELTVAKSDMGRIVGKKGEMLRTIRYFLNALSSKSKTKSYLELCE